MTASRRATSAKKKKKLKNRRIEPRKDYRWIFSRILYLLVMLMCGGALLLGAGFGMYMLSMSDAFRIEHIEVDGNQRLSTEDILSLSDIRHGQGTFDLDLELIGQRLEENDWILKAQVERRLPCGVKISIVEHTPCCIINLDYLYYVDLQGKVFKVLHRGDPLDYPMVSGIERDDLETPDAPGTRWLKRVVEIVAQLEKRTVFNIDEVAQIHVDFERGIDLYTLEHGVTLRLGHDQFGSKFNLLEHMYPQLKPELNILEYIDLNVPGKLIVKKRDGDRD
ncbi:MAG: FtsQ-type POTRA domain-containing protein [Desulfuromonadaceae bacterium]|nr:FtsQ-type POTRA domain-containing protein [Desulfuromonadaceae bacterium]